MKTITIKSEFANLFNAYETTAVTNKGVMRIRCIQLNKEVAEKMADEDNRNVPFFSKTFDCIIYRVNVHEITVCVY